MIRRWFLKHHGITFHSWQRMLRLNTAFNRIQEGASVTDAAFGTGFESLSGFGDSFRNVFGVSPNKSKDIQVIQLARIETMLGTMVACATKDGICLLEFSDRKMLPTSLKQLSKKLNATIIQGSNPHIALLEKELKAYFEGSSKTFTVPLVTTGTPFQESVWKILREIPYGRTRSYRQQAELLQQPSAVRAVGTANGMNIIAIVIPCHRVLGADGQLTGYGGGLHRKKWLLEHEAAHARQG
jgi:AraC family transcriptional regulator of adaptative response/methylated-DNA-[protein]-cysteine methyltransferase